MIYRGRVSRIVGNDVYVEISALAVDQEFGPMELVTTNGYSVNDYVLVSQIDGAAEDLVVVGVLKEELESIGSAIPTPTQNDSFFVGTSAGSYSWRTKAQSKVHLDIDDAESAITALQSEVQPVARGGTGITLWTTGNYVKASGATTLQQRTPAQVASDLGIDQTLDANKPVSTLQQAALNLKQNLAPTVFSTGQNFNTLTTPGTYVWSANAASNTNAPEATAGTLSVIGNTANNLTQTFTSYASQYTYSRTYNGTTWGFWLLLTNQSFYSGQSFASSLLNLTTTRTDITGAALTLDTYTTAAVYMVTGVFDFQDTASSGANTAVGELSVGGTIQSQVAVFGPSVASGRATVVQKWRLTGITPTTGLVFKLTGRSTAGTNWRANATTTGITIEQVAA